MTAKRPFRPEGLAFGDGDIWLIDHLPALVRADPESLRVSEPVRLTLPFKTGVEYLGHREMSFGHGYLWIPRLRSIARVAPGSLDIRELPIEAPGGEWGDSAVDVAVGPSSIWVSGIHRDTITEVDPDSCCVIRTLPIPRSYRSLVVADHRIWMLDVAEGGALVGLDSQTGELLERIDLRGFPTVLAAGGSRVWATSQIGVGWEVGDEGDVRSIRPETPRVNIVSADIEGGLRSEFQLDARTATPHPFSGGLIVEITGEGSRVLRLDPAAGGEIAELDIGSVTQVVEAGEQLWILAKEFEGLGTGAGRELARLTRLDPKTNQATATIGFDDVEISDLLEPWVPPPPHLFEQQFREALEVRLSSHWGSVHPETGDLLTRRSTLGPGRSLVEVRLRGEHPDTEVQILFRDEARPDRMFGLAEPVWFREGESWDVTPDSAAMIFQVNVFDEPPHVQLPKRCSPDGEGITWVRA